MVLELAVNRNSVNATQSAFILIQLSVKFFLRIVNVKAVLVNFIEMGHKKFLFLTCFYKYKQYEI